MEVRGFSPHLPHGLRQGLISAASSRLAGLQESRISAVSASQLTIGVCVCVCVWGGVTDVCTIESLCRIPSKAKLSGQQAKEGREGNHLWYAMNASCVHSRSEERGAC